MASPARSSSSGRRRSYSRRTRRSSFNGARQLSASQAPNRRVMVLLGLLVLALLVAIGTIAFHLVGGSK